MVAEFFEYLSLQQYSEGQYRQHTSYFKKHLQDRKFDSPLALQKYIDGKQAGVRHITKVARVYLNYCEKFERLSPELIEKYRKFLKIRHSRVDVYVPSDEEVQDAYSKVQQDSVLGLILLVLATSGIRLVECLDFLKGYDQKRFKQHKGFVSYPVAELRHTKNINNIYLPDFVYKQLQHINASYQSIRMQYKRNGGTLSLKYLRKWHYNFMLYNQVPESVADFIQGRSSKSVSANHYLAKSQQAEHWYGKVLKKLRKGLKALC